MLVKNNNDHIVQFGLKNGSVDLFPGVNDIREEFLRELRAHPLYKSRVDHGHFEELTEEREEDGRPSVRSLLKLIPHMTDVNQLEDLLESEDRETIKKAVKKQLSKLEVNDSDFRD